MIDTYLQERSDKAREEGRQAASKGLTFDACPYGMAQGSPKRVEALGWRAGFQSFEVDEAEGQHFKSK